MGAPHSDRERTSVHAPWREAQGHASYAEDHGADTIAFAAVAAFDQTAADLACALLPFAPHRCAHLLCLDDDHVLRDVRETSEAALRAELHRNPIRTRAALAQTSLHQSERRSQTLFISRDTAGASCDAGDAARKPRRPLVAGGWIDHPADGANTVARLLDFHLRKGRPPVEAVRAALETLRGAVAVAAILPDDPDRIFVVAKETDVLVGFGGGGACAVSEASMRPPGSAFWSLYPGDVAMLTPIQIIIVDPDGMQMVKHRPSAALVDTSSHVATP